MEKFLSGQCVHHPGEIIYKWYKSPDGVIRDNSEAEQQMWGLETNYWEVKQAWKAVKPNAGLHVHISVKQASGSLQSPVKVEWMDIGATTVPCVKDILMCTEPFLFQLLSCVARGNSKFPLTEDGPRKTQPIEMVITHAISSLNFCLNCQANWLPVA
ncbi:hypothetical protein Moror_9041 [Moniliophthora roreri MCA 2997]|uniref:Uncharacterized protein n=1 Tax=Moniliophthora roreri (strain MCA 2997) TaxID=1381753 RepID=V2X1F6_MONRO|nr:hypothetical protein Moror_9041 [Moniliophthora roreri MCA 2997]